MKPLAGLSTPLLLALRRERFRLPASIIALAFWVGLLAISLVRLYPDQESRQGLAETINNPGSTFLIGRIYRAENYHWDAIIGHETLLIVAIAVSILSILTVVRHTRAEEEEGRIELLRAGLVGRHTHLATGVLISIALNAGIAAAVFCTLLPIGGEVVSSAGSLVYVSSLFGIGLVFTAVAALAAQITATGRAATGLSGLVLAASFLVRGIADTSESAENLAWASPLGWIQRTFPWDQNNLLPLLACVLVSAALLLAACIVNTNRDLGTGLVAPRTGRPTARTSLLTPLGFAARLNRTNTLGWLIGLAIFAAMYGPILGDAENFLSQMPVLADFIPTATDDSVRLFASIIVSLGALVISIPAIQVVTRLVNDEKAGRIAAVLANHFSRTSLYGATILFAVIVAAALSACFGVVLGLTAAHSTGDTTLLGEIIIAALGYLGSIVLLIALAGFLASWIPRAV
ncbi:ABC transporter permease, partial [Ancrocorticia sp.]